MKIKNVADAQDIGIDYIDSGNLKEHQEKFDVTHFTIDRVNGDVNKPQLVFWAGEPEYCDQFGCFCDSDDGYFVLEVDLVNIKFHESLDFTECIFEV